MSTTARTQVEESSITVERTFKAPREEVFDAWTNPAKLKRWWAAAPDDQPSLAEVDLRVGGAYRLGMQKAGAPAPVVVGGKFMEVSPPERLVYTWEWEGEMPGGAPTQVTVEFRQEGAGTRVVITHERFESKERGQSHAEGWGGCLESLAGLLGE